MKQFQSGNPSSKSNVCPSDRSSLKDCWGTCTSNEVIDSSKIAKVKSLLSQVQIFYQNLLKIKRKVTYVIPYTSCGGS
jgi:hypothetical protein